MLRRLLALLAMLGASFVVVVAAAPSVNADGCDVDKGTGEVGCEDTDNGETGGGNDQTGGSSTCTHDGSEIPCTGPGGSIWSSSNGCYVGAIWEPQVVVPVPAGQKKDGVWHVCYFPPPGSSWKAVYIENDTVTVDPVVLANRAVAAMDLDPITIGIVPESAPDRVGLVGLPVWMWAATQTEDTWGPITRSASEGTVSVSATARVSSVLWDMGDGTTVTCTGPGTSYADQYGKQDSPTCGHRYAKMSSGQPDGAYQVTATSDWVIEWTGGGQAGTIELDLTTEPVPIRVGEAQVLTQ